MNDSNKDSSTVATGEPDVLALADALEAMQPAFAADRDKLTRAAEALRRLHAAAIPKEPMTRFCPGCGSLGEVDRKKFRDCCPDGVRARVIPVKLAEKCHDLFQVALQVASQPEVEQVERPKADGRGRKPLTPAQMEAGREAIFSTGNPFCPCDSKTFRKVAQWTERHHRIGVAPATQEPATK